MFISKSRLKNFSKKLPLKKFFSFFEYHHILLILILSICFVIRLNNYYPIDNEDEARDYSLSHQIVISGNYPLVGPPHSVYGEGFNSPWYYYFLSSILKIQDSLFFLRFVNILLQMGSILMIYAIGSLLFRPQTGLIAASMFGFSIISIFESHEIWQSHIMMPFWILSCLFLVIGYKKKSYPFLISSVVVYMLSTTMHTPPVLLAPGILFLFGLILFLQKRPASYYLGILLTFFLSFILFYGTVILSHFQSGSIHNSNMTVIPVLKINLHIILVKFFENLAMLSNTLFLNANKFGWNFSEGVIMACILLVAIYFYRIESKTQKIISILLLSLVLLQALSGAIVPSELNPIHLAPVIPFIVLIIAAAVDFVLDLWVFLSVFKVVFVITIISVVSGNFSFFTSSQYLYFNQVRFTNASDYKNSPGNVPEVLFKKIK